MIAKIYKSFSPTFFRSGGDLSNENHNNLGYKSKGKAFCDVI